MKHFNLIAASVFVITATLGAAHAAQVIDASCPDENNGTLGETASHQSVICANGKWQDVKTVPMASMNIAKYRAGTTLEATYTSASYVGTRNIRQSTDVRGQFTLVATVVALNPNKTAHIVIDFDDAGLKKHVDATVPLDTPTAVTSDNDSAEYRVTIKRIPA